MIISARKEPFLHAGVNREYVFDSIL